MSLVIWKAVLFLALRLITQHWRKLCAGGTELSIRVVCEEHWSYESDHVCFRVRIIDPEVQRAEDFDNSLGLALERTSTRGSTLERTSTLANGSGGSTTLDVRARHIPRRLTV